MINRWLNVLHAIYNFFSCPCGWWPLSCRPVRTWPFISHQERRRWRRGLICHWRSLCCIRSAAATGSRTAATRTRTAGWGQRFRNLTTKINYCEYLLYSNNPLSWINADTQLWGWITRESQFDSQWGVKIVWWPQGPEQVPVPSWTRIQFRP